MTGQLFTKFLVRNLFFSASPTADTAPLERKVKVRRDFAKHTPIKKGLLTGNDVTERL